MKTTVKLTQNRAVVVRPARPGIVPVDLTTFGVAAISVDLTPDQAAILGEALITQATMAEGKAR